MTQPSTTVLSDDITMYNELNENGLAILIVPTYDDWGDRIGHYPIAYDNDRASALVSTLKNGAVAIQMQLKDKDDNEIGMAGADVHPYGAITIINTFTKLFDL